ncbi:HAD family hydrolase [Nocardioides sp. SR21]|uniref:HAD family hydrolase n=1 Tax=Nocardioides sp. SR21 TaxID=2919501 RepID=UPI001FA9F858|nr:HAD-IA family hydrolase [Nocardioides sp. SR21]
MPTYDACLIDVFETVLSVDNARHAIRFAARAGVSPGGFASAAAEWGAKLTDGRATLAEAITAVVRGSGGEPEEDEVAALVAADRELIIELAVLHPDTVPFLEELRAAGVRTAFVSNCSENTRPLLDALGLSDLVDELVLSCEVGSAKPEPTIYQVALDRLGVTADRAVFVDDQQRFCDGATDLGITAIRIDRRGTTGDVNTLAGLADRLFARA